MSNNKLVLLLLLFTFLLFGCTDSAKQSDISFNMIATEKTLPPNYEELANQNTTPSFSRYLVRKAADSTQFENHWQLYGFSQPVAEVDFTKNDVFFFGLYESGSCPNEIKNLHFDQDRSTLTVPIVGPDGDCTADASPRTIAIQLEKGLSEQIHEIIMLEFNTETIIPIAETN